MQQEPKPYFVTSVIEQLPCVGVDAITHGACPTSLQFDGQEALTQTGVSYTTFSWPFPGVPLMSKYEISSESGQTLHVPVPAASTSKFQFFALIISFFMSRPNWVLVSNTKRPLALQPGLFCTAVLSKKKNLPKLLLM